MKTLALLTFLILGSFQILNASELYQFSLISSKGESLNLKKFQGKALLVVNIATRCGYTGQLDGLEKLYAKYKAKGFEVLGVPSNDFGSQTPEGNAEIAKFCRLKYGVNFDLSHKVIVKGSQKVPLMEYLIKTSGGGEIAWNFEKFLFDRNGRFVKRFSSDTSPSNSSLEEHLKKLLN